MHPLIEKYGTNLMSELLDVIIIRQKSYDNWRNLLLENNIIKPTTRIVRGHIFTNEINERTERINGQIKITKIEPYTKYAIRVYNGRNELILNLNIKSNEIQQLLEELENETN